MYGMGRDHNRICEEDGVWLGRRIGASKYLECSAKTGEGVPEVFEAATREELRYLGRHKQWTR